MTAAPVPVPAPDTASGSAGAGKIVELESIRGLAAALIVFYHIPPWSFLYGVTFIKNAYLMGQIFFVLSGFVIGRAYATRLHSLKDVARFQFLRLGRLYPVHLVFLAIFVGIELAKLVAQQRFGIASPNSQPFRENSLTALWQNLLLVQAIGPTGNATSFNGPAWSISVEFYTYLVFAGVVLAMGRRAVLGFAALAVAALAALVLHADHGFEQWLSCLAGFFLGCCVDHCAARTRTALPRPTSAVVFALLVLFLAVKVDKAWDPLVFFLTAALIHALVTQGDGVLNRMLAHPLPRWLGELSFSIYMAHYCIIWAVGQFVRVALKRPTFVAEGRVFPRLGLAEDLLATGLIVVLVLVVASLTYRFIESPMRRRSRAFAARVLA